MTVSNNPRVGIGVLIFNEKNEILLGERLGSHGASTWAPPGGHLEFGETIEACAMREVLEETGLRIAPPSFLGLTNHVFVEDQKHYISILMKAQIPKDQVVRNCEPEKNKAWQWWPVNHPPQNLFPPLEKLFTGESYGADFLRQEGSLKTG